MTVTLFCKEVRAVLFNSYIFILLFLPLCLLGYFGLNHFHRYSLAMGFLLGMSLWFYGYFNPSYLAIIVTSIVLNYGITRLMRVTNGMTARKAELIGALLVNFGILFYFKYFDFFIGNVNSLFAAHMPLKHIVLPLGGSRKGTAQTCLNVMIVFLCSGLWHGAAWNFVIWGGIHGACMVFERLMGKRLERIPALIRWCGTFLILNLAWVIFRAETLTDATRFFGRLFAGSPAIGGLTAAFQLPEITALFKYGLNRTVPSMMPKLVGAAFYGFALWMATRRENAYDVAEELEFGGVSMALTAVLLV